MFSTNLDAKLKIKNRHARVTSLLEEIYCGLSDASDECYDDETLISNLEVVCGGQSEEIDVTLFSFEFSENSFSFAVIIRLTNS